MIIYSKTLLPEINAKRKVVRKSRARIRTIFKKQNQIHKIPVLYKARAKKYWAENYAKPPAPPPEVKAILYTGPVIQIHEAKKNNLGKYFTNLPCKNGHIAQRYTKTYMCQACVNVSVKKHQEKNRKKPKRQPNHARTAALAAGETQYTRLQPCRRCGTHRYSTKKNRCRECHNASKRSKNPPKPKQSPEEVKRRRADHDRAKRARRRARLKNCKNHHTGKEVRDMAEKQGYRCINCKTCVKQGYEVDHIVALAKGGDNGIDNIQLLCRPCNHDKSDKDPGLWAQENGRLI